MSSRSANYRVDSVDDYTTPAPKETAVDRKERKEILEELRGLLLRDPNVPLDPSDILPDGIEELTLDELRNMLLKARLYRVTKTNGFLPKWILEGVNACVKTYTKGEYHANTATKDEEMIAELDQVLSNYFGYMPYFAQFFAMFFSHIQPTSATPAMTTSRIISQSQATVNSGEANGTTGGAPPQEQFNNEGYFADNSSGQH